MDLWYCGFCGLSLFVYCCGLVFVLGFDCCCLVESGFLLFCCGVVWFVGVCLCVCGWVCCFGMFALRVLVVLEPMLGFRVWVCDYFGWGAVLFWFGCGLGSYWCVLMVGGWVFWLRWVLVVLGGGFGCCVWLIVFVCYFDCFNSVVIHMM